MDLRALSAFSRRSSERVEQLEDAPRLASTLDDGWTGTFPIDGPEPEEPFYDRDDGETLPPARIPTRKGRARPLPLDMIPRLWEVHRRMQHVSFATVARMAFLGELGVVDVAYWEIRSAIRNQDPYSCALAKWRRLNTSPGSGIPTISRGTLGASTTLVCMPRCLFEVLVDTSPSSGYRAATEFRFWQKQR